MVWTHRFHATHPLEEYDTAGVTTRRGTQDDFDIYETVLDNGPPGVTLPPQPPPLPPPLPQLGPHAPTNNPPMPQEQPDGTAPSSDSDSEDTQSSTNGSQICPNQPSDDETNTAPSMSADEMDPVDAYANEQQPSQPAKEDTNAEAGNGIVSPYQDLTHGPQPKPNSYQALLDHTSGTLNSQPPSAVDCCSQNQQVSGEGYSVPPFRAGYRLLGIREGENVYQVPQQQNVEDSRQARPP